MSQGFFSFAVVLAVSLIGSVAMVTGNHAEFDNQTFPGIVARSGDFLRPITVNTSAGVVEGFRSLRNTSDWVQLRGENYAAISQNYTFPKLRVVYDRANLTVGRLATIGKLTVNLTDTPVNVTLTATKVESACDLKVTAVPYKSPVNLTMEDGGLAKRINHSSASMLETAKGQLTSLVGILTPNILSYSVGEKLASIVNLDELCKSLLGRRAAGLTFAPKLNLTNV